VILAVAPPGDAHAQAVGRALDALSAEWRPFDLARFPLEVSLALRHGGRGRGQASTLALPGGPELPLAAVRAVWWRRPGRFLLDPALSETHRAFAELECQHALQGLWQALPARWVNPPLADLAASRKPWQLSAAEAVGLAVPRTLVTNDPGAARAFLSGQGRRPTVFKAFGAVEAAWRFTRLVGARERRLLPAVRHAPVIFQEYVPAERDLRVVVVGGRIFAVEIDARRTGYPLDYRADFDAARVEPCRLPPAVERKVRALTRRLGLCYGALDLRRKRGGEHVFLEVNPTGQWLFVEERTGLPITRAVARLLAGRR
jgi:hypothetical protein